MALDNTSITMHGNPVEVTGSSLKIGDVLPPFTLSGPDLKDLKLESFKGKVLILSVAPSVDTAVCALQTKNLPIR